MTRALSGKAIAVLAGVIGSLLLAVGLLSWQLTNKIEQVGALQTERDTLAAQLVSAEQINRGLVDTITDLEQRQKDLLDRIYTGEREKRLIRAQLDDSNAELRKALAAEPGAAECVLPRPVSAVLNRQLGRLYQNQDGNPG